jgi:hypothetical protein
MFPVRQVLLLLTHVCFGPPRKTPENPIPGNGPGIFCVISRNPFLWIFAYTYPLLIIAIGPYLIKTWNLPDRLPVEQLRSLP